LKNSSKILNPNLVSLSGYVTVLLNYLYEKDPYFEIKTNIGSIAAVDLEKGFVRIHLNEKEFDDRAFGYEGIMPDSSNFKTALISAGILKSEKQEVVFREIIVEFGKNLYERPRLLYVSFDTNAFINRTSFHLQTFAERIERVLGAFVVPDGIKQELFSEKAGKYGEYELRELMIKDKRFGEFINQPKVIERVFKIGRAEFNRFRTSVRFEEIPSGTGDNEIAKALGEFSRRRNCDVWLITFDHAMYEIAAGYGIRPLLLDFPRIKRRVDAEWENIRDFIYIAAVIFGFVTISGVDIFGVWRGKKPDDWNNECVKVLVKNENLKKDLKILREIKDVLKI